MAAAARAAGRDPGSIRVLAVSKTVPVEAIRAAYALGQRAFGENYVQEAIGKIATLSDLDCDRMASDRSPTEQQGARWRPRTSPGCRPSTGCRSRNVSRRREGQRAAAAECLRSGQHQRRGQQERVCPRSRARPCPGGCPIAAAGVARIHGHRGRNRRYRRASARSSARCVPCSIARVRRAYPSTRCRWACRRTWKPRSRRGARWSASAVRCSARVREKLNRRAHEHHLHRRRQHGARARRRLDRARRRRRTRLQSSRSTPKRARRSRRGSASRHFRRSSPPPS